MAIYFLSADPDAIRARIVEQRLRRAIPQLASVASVQEAIDRVTRSMNEPIYLLYVAPSQDRVHFATLVETAASHRGRIFFVLISNEMAASDYKAQNERDPGRARHKGDR